MTESLFDSDLALANSSYNGVILDPEHKLGRKLYVVGEAKLLPDTSDAKPAHDVIFLHDQFTELVSGEFPCLGAHAAIHEGTYRFGVYDTLGSIEATAGLGRDLRRFVGEQQQFEKLREYLHEGEAFGDFTSFAAVFKHPVPASEQEFEELLWQQLQLLHDHDAPVWDPARSAVPGNDFFAYCFAGRAFFIVGFNPQASELPRRFAYCALVFNAEYQITRLHEEGRFHAFATAIRNRYERLAGRLNPSVPRDMDAQQDETRVYSGVAHPEGEPWSCPLRVRPDVTNSLPASPKP